MVMKGFSLYAILILLVNGISDDKTSITIYCNGNDSNLEEVNCEVSTIAVKYTISEINQQSQWKI